ncbi:MAG: GDYXXLXY domain-containing protein [Alphaproteobacteria bacterium]|nr:GDYXXLXY domain-containing protein [Alphaproteobacteria bacterium]
MTRTRLALALALLLPVAGTVAGIAAGQWGQREATEWRIPVEGADPRDPLRGRFIAFRYRWTVTGEPALCATARCALCLEDGGRSIRVVATDAACPARVNPAASRLQTVYAAEIGGDAVPLAVYGRLWVSEASAPALEAQLRSRPMRVVARLLPDGRLANLRLEPDEPETRP